MSTHWYDDWENVKALGRYLAFERGAPARALQLYYEQPSLFQEKWNEMKAYELQERRLASEDVMAESIRRQIEGR